MNKIWLHWIIIATLITLIIIYIDNNSIQLITTGILVATIFLNEITYLRLKNNSISLIKSKFFFIPTSLVLINLRKIEGIYLVDLYKTNINKISEKIEFEGEIVVELLMGSFFYKPKYKLIIDLKDAKQIEFDINYSTKGLSYDIMVLQKRIRQKGLNN